MRGKNYFFDFLVLLFGKILSLCKRGTKNFSVISNLVPKTVASKNKVNSTGKAQGKNSRKPQKLKEKTQNSRGKLNFSAYSYVGVVEKMAKL